MKQRIITILLALLLAFSMPLSTFAATTTTNTHVQMRGIWVSSVLNLDYPSAGTTNVATLKAQADTILNKAAAMGMNTIFLQVRPSSDALYKSKIFPWSRYLTGKQGTAPADGFDPLAYWVAGAHARGLKLQAWINPYRITKYKDTEWVALSASNPAKLHTAWVKKGTDGNYYYDPGIPEVRQLVISGVQEILNGYAVDGIHIDDYFYPSGGINDAATFSTYGKGYSDIGSWRRENVNILVRALYKAVHTKSSSLVFGVSPSGIWANKSHNALGSSTSGSEAYYTCYADSLQWIKEGCVDYLVPQIYWQIGNKVADYKTLVNWWANAVSGSKVKLYIGEAAYRCSDASETAVWKGAAGVTEIVNHLKLCATVNGVSGNVYFRYGSMTAAPALSSAVTSYYKTACAQQPYGTTAPVQATAASQAVQKTSVLQTVMLFFAAIIR